MTRSKASEFSRQGIDIDQSAIRAHAALQTRATYTLLLIALSSCQAGARL